MNTGREALLYTPAYHRSMLTLKYVLLYVLLIAAQTQGINVSCAADSVKRGEAAKITCTFIQDKSQFCNGTFRIDRYPLQGSLTRDIILVCPVTHCISECNLEKRVYEFNHTVDKVSVTLTVNISSASTEHEGTYVCQKVGGGDEKDCNFTLKATQSVQTTPRQGTTAAPSGNEGTGLSTTPTASEIGTAQPAAQKTGSELSSGVVAGIVCGVLLSLGVAVAVIWVFVKFVNPRCKKDKESDSTPQNRQDNTARENCIGPQPTNTNQLNESIPLINIPNDGAQDKYPTADNKDSPSST